MLDMAVSLADIRAARERIRPYIRETDIVTLTLPGGGEALVKCENLQATGAFKVRGAANCILMLTEAQQRAGVLAASAGNHAQGVARTAQKLAIACTIVMPLHAPLSKIAATESYGAKVVLYGETYDDACAYALRLAEETGMTFVHPFDDERVIAGQGTIALEILDEVHPGQVIVPVGGGGLIAGVAAAIKQTDPAIRVIGVEPASAASMRASIQAGRVVTLASAATLADGIAVKTPGELTYRMCREYVDEIVTVDDDDIAKAILYLIERSKIVSEGAGAAPIAALLAGKIGRVDGGTLAVLSGGNIDVTMVSRIIDKGLIRAGRKFVLRTELADTPGQLARLLELVSGTGANIVSVSHDRNLPELPINASLVSVEMETRDRQHVFAIRAELADRGYRLL